jgi:glycosyltransferase involved in cell wall biosynthesis
MNGAGETVLFAGAWDEGPGYPRTSALRAGLRSIGVTVRECRVPGLGASKQALLRRPWRWPVALLRQRRRRRDLRAALAAALAAERPRCVVVPYPGHAVVGDVARLAGVPVVLDLFLSAYDTVVEDRRVVAPGSLVAHWLQEVDTAACRAADLVLLDTPAHAAYVAALTQLPSERFAWLPLADPDAPIAPTPAPAPVGGRLRLLFFGTGVPLHGLRTLIDAVAECPGVDFELVGGTAQERDHAVARLGARLLLQPEFVPPAVLRQRIAAADLVAGVFGTSGKAQRVVPWKLVHALAAGRPVVTGATPAVLGWLDGCPAVVCVQPGDPAALAVALRQIAADPARLAAATAAARPAYDRHFAIERCGERWRAILARAAEAPGWRSQR